MKKLNVLIFFLLISTIVSAKPVQSRPNLIKELNDLEPSRRILRSSKHLDSLLKNGTPLSLVTERIAYLILHAEKLNDSETANYLRFYDQIKRGLLPVSNEEKVAGFKAAVLYFEDKKDYRYTGVSHYYLGQHYYERKEFGEAFYHHSKALQLFDKAGLENIFDIGKYLHVIALNYYYFGYYDKAIQLMRASISLPVYNKNLGIQRFNTLGSAYQKLDMADSAAYFFKRTQEVASALQDTLWINIASGNLGTTFMKSGKYKEALPLLMQDYQYNRDNHRQPVLARNTAAAIAGIWEKLGKQDSLIHYLRESERLNASVKTKEPMWKEQREEQFYITYYEAFHNYYKKTGNALMAYHYLDSLTQLRNETNLVYNRMTAKSAEDRLKIEQQLAEFALQEADKKRISTRFQFIIGIIGLLAAILGLLYYLLRIKRAKDLLLAQKENIARQAQQDRVQAQLAEANLELKEYMLRLQEKNKLVETFQTQINHLGTAHPESQSSLLEELTRGLADTKLLTQEDWNDFRQRFNRASGGRLDQLKMQFGDITSAEERIYALENMNVATGQMAWMLGISPESVRKTRYRLKKKIGVQDA